MYGNHEVGHSLGRFGNDCEDYLDIMRLLVEGDRRIVIDMPLLKYLSNRYRIILSFSLNLGDFG